VGGTDVVLTFRITWPPRTTDHFNKLNSAAQVHPLVRRRLGARVIACGAMLTILSSLHGALTDYVGENLIH
jgi:hypothetical protein